MTKTIGLLVVVMACYGCSPAVPPATDKPGQVLQANEGYSILYKLMKDESGVDKLLIIKQADEPIVRTIRSIAAACKTAKEKMDEFAKADPKMQFGVFDLPYIEQRSREEQKEDDTKFLLGSSGEAFEIRLVFTQRQSMEYAARLSQALAEKEEDPARKKFLTDLAGQCMGFNDQLDKFLALKSGGK